MLLDAQLFQEVVTVKTSHVALYHSYLSLRLVCMCNNTAFLASLGPV